MRREVREFRAKGPGPVKEIVLNNKNPRLRLLLFITALVLAAGAFFFAFRNLFTVEAGWTELQVNGSSGITVAEDFMLQVELGADQDAPLTERKLLTEVYTNAAREAYTLYTAQDQEENINNLWYINRHPGEEIQVNPKLYRALKHNLAAGNWMYLGPVYEVWDSVWFSQTDEEAAVADPRKDADLAGFVKRVSGYINSGDITLELREDSKVCLTISEEYKAFGEENGITRWLDFGWQKNAYVIDDLADALTAKGWQKAVLSSKDGFIRCLDGRGSFAMNVYAETEAGIGQIAEAGYQGPAALLMLLPAPGGERSHSYRYRDGTLRTAWISPKDGLDVRPVDGLAAYAEEGGCAELLSRFLNCITEAETTEADWTAAAGDDCTLWLAKQGVLSTFGNGKLTVQNAE